MLDTLTSLTRDQSRRIIESISECERFISKEEARSAAYRPADVSQLLEQYKEQRAKLIATLERCA